VFVYPDSVEIKGTIPTQILDKTDKEKAAPIIGVAGLEMNEIAVDAARAAGGKR